MKLVGKIIKKRVNKFKKVDLLIECDGEMYSFEVKPKFFSKLIELQCVVEIVFKNEIKNIKSGNNINKFILEDLKLIK